MYTSESALYITKPMKSRPLMAVLIYLYVCTPVFVVKLFVVKKYAQLYLIHMKAICGGSILAEVTDVHKITYFAVFDLFQKVSYRYFKCEYSMVQSFLYFQNI